MNRHVRIFWGIFCWISVAVCLALAVLNGLATPAAMDGVLVFGLIGVVMAVAGVLIVRDRRV